MRITLFAPCFIDALYPGIAMKAVKIFENLGHQVNVPEELACCGQPAFNTGHWDEARAVASKVIESLWDAEAVVLPSGSCTAMIRKFYPEPQKVFSWWSYRNPNWQVNNKGRRLDHVWVSKNLSERVKQAEILKDFRSAERPSDHVPVMVEIAI